MALRHDSYFNLSKGERRATLWLAIVLVILVGARLARQYLPARESEADSTEQATFQQELKEFGNSLREKETPSGKKQSASTREPRQPKKLEPIPREE